MNAAVTERNAAFNSGYEELVGKSGTLTKAQEEKVVKAATFPLMRTKVTPEAVSIKRVSDGIGQRFAFSR